MNRWTRHGLPVKPQVVTSSQTMVCIGPVADQWRSPHLERCYVDFVPLLLRSQAKNPGSAGVATSTSQMIDEFSILSQILQVQQLSTCPPGHVAHHFFVLASWKYKASQNWLTTSATQPGQLNEWHNEWQARATIDSSPDTELFCDAMRNLKMGYKMLCIACMS